jgi:DNA-binding protein Fis
VMHHARVNAQRATELINQNRGSLRAIIGDIDPRD